MIVSFKHKGLRRFYETGDARGMKPDWQRKVRMITARLDVSTSPDDMALPGFQLHPLKGKQKGYFAVSVTGNWRIVFCFENGQPADVDLVDYH